MKLENNRNKINIRLHDFKSKVKAMIMDGESIPETYNEIIIELEASITTADITIEERKRTRTNLCIV